MKHVSKFDGCVYDISYSMTDENGSLKHDDIILIWKDAPCGHEMAEKEGVPHRELIGWYWGASNYKVTERYIRQYYKAKLNKEN